MTDPHPPKSVLALVDSSPVLLLPSILACRERSGDRPLQVSLAGPVQFDAAMHRLVDLLGRHEITASVQERADTLDATIEAWLNDSASHASHIRRCDAYEIGQISGRPLLELIAKSVQDEPDALLKGLLTVSRGAPRAGLG